MKYLFCNCSSLEFVDLSNFNTSSVLSMFSMFFNCRSLKSINLSLEKIIKNSNFSPNNIQNRIIELIVNNNRITQNEIANIIGVNVRTIKRHFKILINNSMIERIGSDKTGYWQILK